MADAKYVFANLNGVIDGAPDLDPDKEFLALTYIQSQDALVLRETWQGLLGERNNYAVWVYDLNSGENHRIAENVNLGESAVFTEF